MTREPYLVELETIQTKSKEGLMNGWVRPLANELIPGTEPIVMAYLTQCLPGQVKGPHMHEGIKEDRFICVSGSCVVVTQGDWNTNYQEFFLSDSTKMLVIPPYNSHAIVSKRGCTVLSLPNEGYYPGHYNQVETEYPDYDWSKLL